MVQLIGNLLPTFQHKHKLNISIHIWHKKSALQEEMYHTTFQGHMGQNQ